MNLRSQTPAGTINQQAPMILRDLMRKNDLNIRNENQPYPKNTPDPFPHPPMEPQSIVAQTLASNLPVYPPSHIQQQSSVSIPDYNTVYRSSNRQNRTPRKHKIFQNSPTPNNRQSSSIPNQMKNAPSFGSNPPIQYSFKTNDFVNEPNQTIYDTVKNLANNADMNINNPRNQEYDSNIQPNGISLRSKNMMYNQNPPQYNQIPPTYPTFGNVTPGPMPNVYQSGSMKQPNSFTPQNRNTLPNIRYENEFNLTRSLYNYSQNHNPQISNMNQPLYNNINQSNPNLYLDRLFVQDFQQQERHNNRRGPVPSNYYGSGEQISPSNVQQLRSHMQTFLQPSFGPSPSNQYGQTVTYEPPPQNRTESAPIPQPIVTSLSPFQQNERQQFRNIPKRFDSIEQKVFQHEMQLNQMDRKLQDFKLKDGQAQRNLLGQLITKEEQLNQKQREINNNLQHLTKIQTQNNLKKEQILKYELQLQRAKRVQELSKQNQRLYHQLLRKERTNSQYTRDMSSPRSFNQLQPQINVENNWAVDMHYRETSPFTINPDLY